jgi:FKBP-type peptidyl-prolyl cis-trans isomerase FkpA
MKKVFKLFWIGCFVILQISTHLSAQDMRTLELTLNGKFYMIQYQIHHHDAKARRVIKQDFVTFHLQTRTELDSILRTTYPDKPIVKEISMEDYKYVDKGPIEDILQLLNLGDSATFYLDSDMLFESIKRKRPHFIRPGSKVKYIVKVLKIQNELEVQNDKNEVVFQQRKADEAIIAKYVAHTKLPFKKAYSGLWYYIETQGEGDFALKDDVVALKYTGKFLDGKVFSSSDEEGRFFEFPVGGGFAIKALDEVLLLLKKGAKCTFVCPSYLAYGPTGFGKVVPPNTPIMFDIEFIDIISRKIIIENKGEIKEAERAKEQAEKTRKTAEEQKKIEMEKDLKKRGLEDKKKEN